MGVPCTAHFVPFHRSASVRLFFPLRVVTRPAAVHWAFPVQDTPYSRAPVNSVGAAAAAIVRWPAAAGRVPGLSHRAPGPSSLLTALLPGAPAALATVAGPATATTQAAIVASAAARRVMHSSAGLAPPARLCNTSRTLNPPHRLA